MWLSKRLLYSAPKGPIRRQPSEKWFISLLCSIWRRNNDACINLHKDRVEATTEKSLGTIANVLHIANESRKEYRLGKNDH
jgi:hypothetical protein